MTRLTLAARLYVWMVITAGAAFLVLCLPKASFNQPLLFVGLVVLSSATAALKVHLPLTTGLSTMSVSYAVVFASLLLAPSETMLVAAISAFCQCKLNSKETNPTHRTLFSMASLIVTVEGAGL